MSIKTTYGLESEVYEHLTPMAKLYVQSKFKKEKKSKMMSARHQK